MNPPVGGQGPPGDGQVPPEAVQVSFIMESWPQKVAFAMKI